jgi:hypothetical protein
MMSGERGGHPTVVFLGPTMSVTDARRTLDAVYLPPAAQGSIILAVEEFRPKAMLLVDGIFQSEPAVRHKEILWALSRGIPVIGAASMGALRAAELWRYGMIGIGLIFRWYRRFPFAPDHAVAVLHGPADVGWAPLTCALVDLRLTLRAAERQGLIDTILRHKLDRAASRIHYRNLTIPHVVDVAREADGERDNLFDNNLAQMLEHALVLQKKCDAQAALHYLSNPILSDRAPQCEFVPTTAFVRDLEFIGVDAASIN